MFEVEKTASVWDKGHRFRVAYEFSQVCFVFKKQSVDKNDLFYHCKSSKFYRKRVYNV